MVLDISIWRSLNLLVLLCCFSPAIAQENRLLTKKESKFVNDLFPVEWSEEELFISDEATGLSDLLLDGDQVYMLKHEDRMLGYLISTRAMGRHDYFDYLLAFDPDCSVLGLRVTVYRSAHGAAICQKKWLSQFKAYAGEELSYGKDIDALAGATISATSMVKDVNRCYRLMIALKEDGFIQ